MFKPLHLIIGFLVAISPVAYAQSSTIAYSTFLEAPQRFGQQPGFGYYGGAQATSSIFGVSFVPTVSGYVSDVWIAAGSSLSDVGTDIFDLYLATSGSEMEPETIFASAEIQGELSKRESVVHIPSDSQSIFIEQGKMYWMLIAPGLGTPEVGWLGGPPNAPPGSHSAYPDSGSSTGWFVSPNNSNGAMRIDVTPVPEPSTHLLMLSGFLLTFSCYQYRMKRGNTGVHPCAPADRLQRASSTSAVG